MHEFKLPSLGADMENGTLVEWKVKPGDYVKRGAVVAVIDTEKAAVEVEFWNEGTIQELLVHEHETVPVGTAIATFLLPGEKKEEAPAKPPAPAAPSQRISPLARKRAAELGVELSKLNGTGPDGAITVADVEKASKREAAPSARQVIAALMAKSKREIPHYYLSTEIPMERALAWLSKANEKKIPAERLLPAVLLLKAVALAAKAFPEMNGYWKANGFEVGKAVHLGVAISLRQGGLVAPALHDADKLSLAELMRALSDLVSRARSGRLRSSEMSDPTMTVTNLGDQGGDSVLGVIYPPQVALIGFGKIAERPWAENGVLRAIPSVVATLSADHRASDGHRGSLFLGKIRESLQKPETL